MHAVIGAGMGGLLAAIRLAQTGRDVVVFEARDQVGGLAGRLEAGGQAMDGGPYILLDRPGLAWAFEAIGESLEDHVRLLPLDEVWRVTWSDGSDVRIYASLDRTAEELEARWPGSGTRYRDFIAKMSGHYQRLAPLQRDLPPKPWQMLHPARLPAVPFLLQPLGRHLAATGLPDRVQQALGIWTHVANQPLDRAPAPLAFVPALVHGPGAWVPEGGIHRIPEALHRVAERHGVGFRFGQRVEAIERTGDRITSLRVDGERIEVEAVVSNAPGIGTYADLLQPEATRVSSRLKALPLQSPGVAAWFLAQREDDVPFLRFRLTEGAPVGLAIHFGAVDPSRPMQGRLLSPMDHTHAAEIGVEGQERALETLLGAPWWQEGLSGIEVVDRRIPVQWGRRHHLYRDSMNPVMTAAFMRQGRIPHQSPVARNLTLAGAATHPGQWVSFCAISGVLAAELAVS